MQEIVVQRETERANVEKVNTLDQQLTDKFNELMIKRVQLRGTIHKEAENTKQHCVCFSSFFISSRTFSNFFWVFSASLCIVPLSCTLLEDHRLLYKSIETLSKIDEDMLDTDINTRMLDAAKEFEASGKSRNYFAQQNMLRKKTMQEIVVQRYLIPLTILAFAFLLFLYLHALFLTSFGYFLPLYV
jgi:hypothetical protein